MLLLPIKTIKTSDIVQCSKPVLLWTLGGNRLGENMKKGVSWPTIFVFVAEKFRFCSYSASYI